MDGLDEFEKAIATEKAEREREEERKHRKHRHHHHRRDRSTDRDRDGHRHRHHHSSHDRDDHDNEDEHRHKRSRHSRDDDDDGGGDHHHRREHSRREHRDHRRDDRDRTSGRHSHVKTSDVKEDLPLPDEEIAAGDSENPASSKTLVRDSWMTDPSAIDIDYVQKRAKQRSKQLPPPRQEPKREIHAREINAVQLQTLNEGKSLDELDVPAQHEVDYQFGDSGSQWRMTKLNGVYRTAEESGRSVEEVAFERYGSLQEFDDAREEKIELDRRKVYGEGYVGKEKPSGELFQERKLDVGTHEKRDVPAEQTELEQGTVIPDDPSNHTTTQIDQTALNRLRAQMMKAKLKKAPDAAKLEAEYNQAVAAYKAQGPEAVVLSVMENRMLAGTRAEAKAVDTKRGRERGLVEQNDEMTIEDMVREERRTRGQGDGLRLAERIAKDGKFDNDLEYMDENAEKLARRVQKSELNLKSAAVGEFQKINRILDSCPLCHHEDRTGEQAQPVAPVVSLATRVYLTLPTEPELADGGAVIAPLQHRTNLLECDDDEWEEIRNFMKCLTRMYHEQGREVVFYENAASPRRHPHAAMQAVPIPYDLGATAPAFFREAILAADEEWTQHRKVIDTGRAAREGGMGKLAFRRSIAREAPYFHAWFSLDGGLGHVVEDENRWPRGDLFAREVLGGMMDAPPDVIKKQGRWRRGEDAKRAEAFRRRWRKFDWTRVLAEGQ